MAVQNDGIGQQFLSDFVKYDHETPMEELHEMYEKWCVTYDAETINVIRYMAPGLAAALLSSQMKELGFQLDAPILDLGCGTGRVGQELRKLGHNTIDGLDFSQKSLEVAKGKEIYRKLIRGSMMSDQFSELGVEGGQYDASICVGLFCTGHVRAAGLDDLVHVVKSGGLVCFAIRDDVVGDPRYGFEGKMEELTREKKWQLLQKFYDSTYHLDYGGSFYVYQTLANN